MQRMKVLALCVAVLLAFSGLASAKQGIDVKASVLFGTKLDVDDVGNIGAKGTGEMEWVYDTETEEFNLKTTGTPGEKVAVSPEEEGYPILLKASYGIDKLQIGGFWLGGFKSEGEATGKVAGFDKTNYYPFETFLFNPVDENSLPVDSAMVFFGGVDVPVLPGMDYYFRHYSKEPGGEDSPSEEGLYILTSTDIVDKKYLRAKVHGGIGEVDFEVNPDAGATEWTSEVSVNLSNYGGNVGYKLFEQNNIGVTAMVGLEQLKWEEEIKNTATENYDINFTSMDIEYAVDSTVDQETLINQLYGDIIGNGEGQYTDVADFIEAKLELEADSVSGANLDKFFLLQDSQLTASRDIEVIRTLDYNPTGYSVGASIGGPVADRLRVSANFSLGWFSGDAKVKLEAKDSRKANFGLLAKEGKGTWSYQLSTDEPGADPHTLEIDIPEEASVWHPSDDYKAFAALVNGLPPTSKSDEKKHTDTEVTLTRAQVSAEYDVTDSVFLGGGFFYSQWKDMPVLSDTDALGIKTQDLVASGVNVEVGVRF